MTNISQLAIFTPVLLLIMLTMLVWFYLYVRRLNWILSERIDPQTFALRNSGADPGPPSVQSPANNFLNLLELPLIFYVVCGYLYATSQVDGIYLLLAWLFVATRAVHSLIQCTANRVTYRFYAYSAGGLVLWTMVVRAAWQLWA
ncbi:MAG: MAPEG family protein [Gammaproteobacteria bacterium]|nr:MAPEG family protein [Gammaproteobacteria bacterium]NND61239.1 hypothetical protein [Gammaproteobacteria bacterium]